ncbi:hybrid sensor histidine kinase/response regulator [Persicobacter psychrovividus]|uniref:histidine kinase n=1 Tax=Persicobacter psychrovividus TaxID=387638 RepID=A0ABM7VHB1_9BACT|nr:hypothetical protein PEPS_26240 [Persicobacter psychrovividus]
MNSALSPSNIPPSFLDQLPIPVLVQEKGGALIYCNQEMKEQFDDFPEAKEAQQDLFKSVSIWEQGAQCTLSTSKTPLKEWELSKLSEDDQQTVWCLKKSRPSPFEDPTFLSVVAHELRTPLNAVLGLAQLLEMENEQENLHNSFKTMQYSAEHLLGLINDVLDFSKILGGKLELDQTRFSPKQLATDIKAMLQQRADARSISLKVLVGDEIPEQLLGDAHRLKQVLINLITNAIKFTEKGAVTIRLERLPKATNRAWLRFVIEDTGIGIPEDRLERIFEPFTQAEKSTTRKFGGTGLGLSISKLLVESMGGNIRVESKEGKGTRFLISMPFDRNEQLTSKFVQRTRKDFSASKVLLVEDDVVNQVITKKYLKKFGINPEIAATGKATLEWVKQEQFDLILMDLHLPDAHGEDLTQTIRHQDKHYYEIPIIALSATRFDRWEENAKLAQMNGYLTKPLNPIVMQRTLEEFFKF